MKVLIACGLLLAAAFLPLFSDPYYHKTRVPLFLWIAREIEENYTGERE